MPVCPTAEGCPISACRSGGSGPCPSNPRHTVRWHAGAGGVQGHPERPSDVHPPVGRVSVSAPQRMKLQTVRLFAISKLDGIRRQQKEIQAQEREPEREYVDRESHFVWGRRCLLVVTEREAAPCVVLRHNRLHCGLRPGTPAEKRHAQGLASVGEPSLMAAIRAVMGDDCPPSIQQIPRSGTPLGVQRLVGGG